MSRYGFFPRALAVGAVVLLLLSVRAGEPPEMDASRAALSAALEQGSVIRLHVIANSDSDEDQALKLRVRDAVLEAYAPTLAASDPSEARRTILANTRNLQTLAEAVVAEYGAEAAVEVAFAPERFPDREYAGMIVPDGTYDSLIISIGEAAGRNWWCVIYPPLCLLTPDTVAAAEAARPVAAIADEGVIPAIPAAANRARLPRNASDLCKVGKLLPATVPVKRTQPVFESTLLRWFRALANNI
ncbi:MAG: stage II sporulation protein R [Oscillospiraceae bacterium]|nr:stage II sporulation protein R [Oscillospiraceae bacterium]